jgi:hypothetical protein
MCDVGWCANDFGARGQVFVKGPQTAMDGVYFLKIPLAMLG